jgi:hypothetical protein
MVLKAIDASQDEVDRWTAISREKFLLDVESDRLTAYENGFQIGYALGIAFVQIEIVQNMRSQGFSDEQVVDLTGISFEDVKKNLTDLIALLLNKLFND